MSRGTPTRRPKGSGSESRRRAVEQLIRIEDGSFASEVLDAPGSQSGRGSSEDRFVRELVLGVQRRRLTLDTIQDAYGSTPSEELDPDARAALRAGFYQLFFMDGVPPHAAVAETLKAVRLRSTRGYVNAVLRVLVRESRTVAPQADRGGASPRKRLERKGRSVTFFSRAVFADPERERVTYLAQIHAHPRFLVARWCKRAGEDEAVRRMLANNEPFATVLRPRLGRVDAEALADRLAREQRVASRIVPRPSGADAVLVPPREGSVFTGRLWRQGLFSAQDSEQMDAVEILDPQPGEHLWDACAAPGGKTGQIAELLEARGGGTVLATDADDRRLDRLRQNVERLGLEGVTVAVHDALANRAPPGRPERGFDGILLDAPCSNTAVLGRRPDARWRLRPAVFEELAGLQRRLVESARRHLAPGGRLVFSTCSLEPEEGVGHGLDRTGSPLVWTTD